MVVSLPLEFVVAFHRILTHQLPNEELPNEELSYFRKKAPLSLLIIVHLDTVLLLSYYTSYDPNYKPQEFRKKERRYHEIFDNRYTIRNRRLGRSSLCSVALVSPTSDDVVDVNDHPQFGRSYSGGTFRRISPGRGCQSRGRQGGLQRSDHRRIHQFSTGSTTREITSERSNVEAARKRSTSVSFEIYFVPYTILIFYLYVLYNSLHMYIYHSIFTHKQNRIL